MDLASWIILLGSLAGGYVIGWALGRIRRDSVK